jgi:phospholipid-binding lipoprotein MlaA
MEFMRKIGFFLLAGAFFSLTFFAAVTAAENAGGEAVSAPDMAETYEDFGAFEDDPFAEESTSAEISDPLESFNRASFWVNDKLYFFLLKPVARAYRVVPEPGRTAAANFFSNLASPVRFANCLLQLKFKDAGNELSRLLLNTTVGVAGLLDPAESLDLDPKDEDFGQTLGRYGVGQGFYLVIPVLGPSSLRDGVGRVADSFFDPMGYTLELPEWIGAKTFDKINYLSLDKDTYENIKKDSLDTYLFIRNVYAQRRQALTDK